MELITNQDGIFTTHGDDVVGVAKCPALEALEFARLLPEKKPLRETAGGFMIALPDERIDVVSDQQLGSAGGAES